MTSENKCPLCGADKTIGKTIYSVDLGFGVVVVRNVPAMVCSQCGEEWIDAVTAKKLEKMVVMAKKNKLQIEMVEFAEVA
ncbi:MAG: type II toxin-antitoxin system MqsA family antitoxin [Nitrospirota bacterium]